MSNLDNKDVVVEANSHYFQKALDMEAMGSMGITPDEKYRREVDVVLSEGGFSTLPPGSKVLDLACGRGDTSKLLKDRGLNVTAVDFSSTAVQVAEERFKGQGIDFRVGDMKRPPSIDGGYDAVTCFGRSFAYFERYEEYVEALKNWRNSLKDNGKIAIEWMEWLEGAGGDNWQSIGGIEMQKDPYRVVNTVTGESVSYGETVAGNFKYPGAKLPTPIENRKGGRMFIDSEGVNHDLGGDGAMFVDLLRQRNFPLIKRMIEEAGFTNVKMVEASKPLTPPGQPSMAKVFAITAEKTSTGSKVGKLISRFRLGLGLR